MILFVTQKFDACWMSIITGKREGKAMPKFSQLFDLKEYEKKKSTIRDNKIYLEFCKMFTNGIVPRSEWR